MIVQARPSTRRLGWYRHPVAAFVVAMAVATISGCASTPPTRFYVLNSVPAIDTSPPTANAIAVVIRDVRLPQYLERPQLVTRGSDHRIQLADEAQWAGNLQQDMMRVLTENLGLMLRSDRVFSAPHNGPLKPDFRVDVEIMRFEQGADRRVALSARWWLLRGDGNTLLESPNVTLYGAVLDERSYESVVVSMSAVYAEFAKQIARSVETHGRAKP